MQGHTALRDEVRGVEVWTTAAYLFDRCHWQRTTAVDEVHTEVLRVDGAPGCCRRGLDALAFCRGLSRREQAGNPPVAQASGASQCLWHLPTQPHFQWHLYGRWRESGVPQLIVRAIVIDDLTTPQASQQGERLLQERAAFGFVDALGQQLRGGGLA